MNKARLEFHRDKQRSLTQYIQAKNKAAMQEWRESWLGVDRQVPEVLDVHAEVRETKAVRLLTAATVLEGSRREGALQRAGRLLREAESMKVRAAALRRGEKPLDEWAVCRCGGAFQPGPRGYTTCWTCSSTEYYKSSYACVFCDRRHSMAYAACFVCKADGREDDARQLRLVVNRRDNYTCSMCGADGNAEIEDAVYDDPDDDAPIRGGGVGLQVSRIDPEGGNWPWNLETLCTTCQSLRGNKGFEKLDEREFWRMVQVYLTHLFEYLAPDERSRLLALEPDTEREQIDFGHRVPWPDLGETDEASGAATMLAAFPERSLSVIQHQNSAPALPDSCKGEIILSTGKRPCRNTADHRVGTLCEGSCR